jgi:hypothetical protein
MPGPKKSPSVQSSQHSSVSERGAATPTTVHPPHTCVRISHLTEGATSADESALLAAMQQIASQYRDGEDIASQALVECLENAGGAPFPLVDLVAHPKTVWERCRQRDRRALKREVSLQSPVKSKSGESLGTLEMVLPSRVTPEARAVQRDEIRRLESDVDVQHAIRRALATESLTRTQQNKASRGKGKVMAVRRKFLVRCEKRRRAVLRVCGVALGKRRPLL